MTQFRNSSFNDQLESISNIKQHMFECLIMLYIIISQTKRNQKTKLSPPNLEYSVPLQNYTGNATHTYNPASSIFSAISYNVIRLGIRFSNNTQSRLSVTLDLRTHSTPIDDTLSSKCKTLRPKRKASLAEYSKFPLENLRPFPPNHPAKARSLAGSCTETPQSSTQPNSPRRPPHAQ